MNHFERTNFSEQMDSADQAPSTWQPLQPLDRRVLGVLIEKAKTTPDSYPLSLNGLRSGCNQKSNRAPQMQTGGEDLEDSLERLRQLGAVSFIQGDGRVEKYRHRAYDWFGVDKVELAIMAELLLRGSQTIGELRSRAARMEPIEGLDTLKPLLDALESKRLIMYLSPKGRGAVVTHTLFLERELDKVRRECELTAGAPAVSSPQPTQPRTPPTVTAGHAAAAPVSADVERPAADFAHQIKQLQSELATLKAEFVAAKTQLEAATQGNREALAELNRQLGN